MLAQADVVHSARRLTAGKPVHISPLTLKPRFNAVATSGSAHTVPPADSRQATSFIAGWTLGSLKYLSEAGASAITCFETTGSRGVCDGHTVYPVGKLLAYIQKIKPQWVYQTISARPLVVSSLMLETERGKFLLLANHTDQKQPIQLPDIVQVTGIDYVIAEKFPATFSEKEGNLFSLEPLSIAAIRFRLLSAG
jgi:D-apionolactonase